MVLKLPLFVDYPGVSLNFRTVKLTGGLTNDLFLCQNDSNYKTSDYDSTVRSVILRIFGTGKTNDIGSFSTLIT